MDPMKGTAGEGELPEGEVMASGKW
jgi:hypothetical protein